MSPFLEGTKRSIIRDKVEWWVPAGSGEQGLGGEGGAESSCLMRMEFQFSKMPRALGGAWVAQSVKCPTLAQVMISLFVSSSSTSSSVLTAQELEPALDFVSPSLCPSLTSALSLSLKNKH